ncbi:hypothetical protein HK405_014218, partial [Cladochytrium tenue]
SHSAFLSYRRVTDHRVAVDFARAFEGLARQIAASTALPPSTTRVLAPPEVTLFSDFWCAPQVAYKTTKRGLAAAKTIIILLSEKSIDMMLKTAETKNGKERGDAHLEEIEEALSQSKSKQTALIPIFVPRMLPDGSRGYFAPNIFTPGYYAAAPRVGNAMLALFKYPGFHLTGNIERLVFDLFRCMNSSCVPGWSFCEGLCEFPPSESVPHLGGKVRSRHVRVPELEHMSRSLKASRFCIVAGAAGIGKSTLAATYSAAHAREYDAFLWINCGSRDSALTSFATARNELGCPIPDVGARPVSLQAPEKTPPVSLQELSAVVGNTTDGTPATSGGTFPAVAEPSNSQFASTSFIEEAEMRELHRQFMWEWLTHSAAPRYLIILDNANDPDVVATLFPAKSPLRGDIIVTTGIDNEKGLDVLRRRLCLGPPGVAKFGLPYIVWLDQWSPPESMHILRESARLINSCVVRRPWRNEPPMGRIPPNNMVARGKRKRQASPSLPASDLNVSLRPGEEVAIQRLAYMFGGCPVSTGLAANYARSEGISMAVLLSRIRTMEEKLGIDLYELHRRDESEIRESRDRSPIFRPTWPTTGHRFTMSLLLSLHFTTLELKMAKEDILEAGLSVLHALTSCSANRPLHLSDPLFATFVSPGTTSPTARANEALRLLMPSGLVTVHRAPRGLDSSVRVFVAPVVQALLQELLASGPHRPLDDLRSPAATVHRVAVCATAAYAAAHPRLDRFARAQHPLRLFAVAFKSPPRALELLLAVEGDRTATAHYLDAALSMARTLLAIQGASLDSMRSSDALAALAADWDADEALGRKRNDGDKDEDPLAISYASIWDVIETDLLRIAALRWSCSFLREARAVLGVLFELQQALLRAMPTEAQAASVRRAMAAPSDGMAVDGVGENGQPAATSKKPQPKSRRRRELELYMTMDAIAFLSHQFEDLDTSQRFRQEAMDGFERFYGSRDHIFVARQLDGLARIYRRRIYFACGGAQGRSFVANAYCPELLGMFPAADIGGGGADGGAGTPMAEPGSTAGTLEVQIMNACRYAEAALATCVRVHGTHEHVDVAYALALAACVKGEAARAVSADGRSCGPLAEDFSPLALDALQCLERLLIVVRQISARIEDARDGRVAAVAAGATSASGAVPGSGGRSRAAALSASFLDDMPLAPKPLPPPPPPVVPPPPSPAAAAEKDKAAASATTTTATTAAASGALVEFEEDAAPPLLTEMALEYLAAEARAAGGGVADALAPLLALNMDGALSLDETRRRMKRLAGRAARAAAEIRAGGDQLHLRCMALCWVSMSVVSLKSFQSLLHPLPPLAPEDSSEAVEQNGAAATAATVATNSTTNSSGAAGKKRKHATDDDVAAGLGAGVKRYQSANSAIMTAKKGQVGAQGMATVTAVTSRKTQAVGDARRVQAAEAKRAQFGGAAAGKRGRPAAATDDNGTRPKPATPVRGRAAATLAEDGVQAGSAAPVVDMPEAAGAWMLHETTEPVPTDTPKRAKTEAASSSSPHPSAAGRPRDAFGIYAADRQAALFRGVALGELPAPSPRLEARRLAARTWPDEPPYLRAFYERRAADEAARASAAAGPGSSSPLKPADLELADAAAAPPSEEEVQVMAYLRRKTLDSLASQGVAVPVEALEAAAAAAGSPRRRRSRGTISLDVAARSTGAGSASSAASAASSPAPLSAAAAAANQLGGDCAIVGVAPSPAAAASAGSSGAGLDTAGDGQSARDTTGGC